MTGVTILALQDREAWERVYAAHGLPSHSWHYANGLAAAGYDPRLAVVEADGARLVLPFFERDWNGHTDIASLPSLSGAAHDGATLAPFEVWAEYARAQGWVCGYVQLAIGAPDLRPLAGDAVVQHNVMIRFDLDSWDFETSVSRNARKSIKKGDRMGAVMTLDKDRLLGPFQDLYAAAMERFDAAMTFPPEAIARWFDDPQVVVFGAEIDGQVEAVHLTRFHGAHAEGHLAATTELGRPLGVWTYWRAAEHFRSLGVRYFNIGGARYEGDNIHWTKGRFNADEFPLLSLRQVYDHAKFEALCAAAGDKLNPGRFPPYRA